MGRRSITFWEKSERFTPILCRLLARKEPGGPPPTNEELAGKMGLTVFEVVALSQQLNWKGVDLPTMKRFVEACGTDFEDPTAYKRMLVYLGGKRKKGLKIAPAFSYLRGHNQWESFFKPLSIRFLEHAKSKTVHG